MALPMIAYGAITGARFAIGVYQVRKAHELNTMRQSTFVFDGGGHYHLYC